MGDFDLQDPEDDAEVLEREIQKKTIHPKNKRLQAYYDIAIVKIDPVELSPAIRPICLPSKPYSRENKYDGDAATVIGWGSYNSLGVTASKLNTATVSIFDYGYVYEFYIIVSLISVTGLDLFQNTKLCVLHFHLINSNILIRYKTALSNQITFAEKVDKLRLQKNRT